ncbi:MAG: hypothetical protein O7D96_04370 [SAR324 cluster bacterium]|nr:hypothetical protein [SAR324 cluster bacterium]
MPLTRRDFLLKSVTVPSAAVAGLAGLALVSCSGDDGGGTSESALSNCTATGTCEAGGDFNVAIAGNHGHTVSLTEADAAAGAEQILVMTVASTNGHTHTVTLTAAMLTDLADGLKLRVTSSSTDVHTHCITFNCSTGSSGGTGY